MRKALSVVLSLVMVLSVFAAIPFNIAAAEEERTGTTGDCNWSLVGTELTISGNGKMKDYWYSCGPWGRNITKVSIADGVTSIGDYAFYECEKLQSVDISGTVTTIGERSFGGCISLRELTIPASVIEINYTAFDDCPAGLQRIKVEDGNTVYDSRNDCNAIIETESDTLILGCKNTIIPDTVSTIGEWAFMNCIGLKSINIPDSVTSIEAMAFRETGLTSISFPNSITSIEGSVFEYCYDLVEINISDSIVDIDQNAFSDSDKLAKITVGKGNLKYDSRDNCNAIIETESNTLFLGCKNTIIPSTVSTIDKGAFKYCPELKSITIPNTVTSIEYHALGYIWGEPIDGFTIYGYSGSEAESYANENGFKFIDLDHLIRGDADSDSDVTIFDATVIQRYLAELTVTGFNEVAADADNDGDITIFDATAIQRYLAELPTYEGIGKAI